ncbi:MAG: hypothetical protein WA004_20790 [Saprospiraceae bacterium]
MKTVFICLSLLCAGVWAQAQQDANPWAVSVSAGYGIDLEQLSSSTNNPYPLVIPTSQGLSDVRFGAPWSLQLGLHIPLGRALGLETGVGFISRSIHYETFFQNPADAPCVECALNIGLSMYRVPLLLNGTPIRSEGKWRLNAKAGLSADWTGIIDPVFYNDGPASKETPSKVEVVDIREGQSYMFLITDQNLSASLLAGLEWELELGALGRIGLGLNFARQLNSSTSLFIWGYSRQQDNRVGGYFPNILQFTSVMGQVRYTFSL